MTEPRWMPTRAGILNVWRYYDEIFEFHKGRLLLRGPNGSGKSKVLELLLPYVLDGSLKASRLSTFGGTERTMHWNLMGDGATGTTRVGYVWVEFNHTDGRWFTCGARLQATTHTTTVTPSYFTTSLRIGDSLALTTETGQPLTKTQLDTALGVHGTVYGSADDYRTQVRQTLYQGLSEARYDSLLAALRQLRTPKLSERLDPGLLSDLLSSALPPLGEGEIHEIAEGFERLDRQRTELQALDEHVEEAARLAAKQRTYAQRVLRAAAHAVTSATGATEAAERELRAKREALRTSEEEQEKVAAAYAETDNLVKRLEAKIDGLKESEEYKQGNDLSKLQTEAREAALLAAERRQRAEKTALDSVKKEENAERARQELSEAEGVLRRAGDDAARIAQHSGLETVYEELREMPGLTRARTLLRAAISARAAQIREVSTHARAHAESVRLRTETEQDRDEALERLASAKEAAVLARTARDELSNDLASAYATWAEGCSLLELDGSALASVAEDTATVETLLGTARDHAADLLATRTSKADHRADLLRTERDSHLEERENLTAETILKPPHTPATGLENDPQTPGSRFGRSSLPSDRPSYVDPGDDPQAPEGRFGRSSLPSGRPNRAGREGLPLWRALAFRPEIDQDVQAAVEAALEAAGLLDLWVLPDGGGDGAAWDAFAVPGEPVSGRDLTEVLVVEPGAPAAVQRLLASVALVPSAHRLTDGTPAAVGLDGTWRLGPAAGRWGKDAPAYLGAPAREQARQRRIAELDALVAALETRLTACETELSALGEERKALDAEFAARPDRGPFNEAVRELDRAEHTLADREDTARIQQERVKTREKEVAAASRRLGYAGARLGLPTSQLELDLLDAARHKADEAMNVWLDARERARGAAERRDIAEETAAAYRDLAERAAAEAEEAVARAEALEERRAAVDSTLDASHRQVLQRIQEAQEERRTGRARRRELSDRETGLKVAIGVLANETAALETRRAETAEARDRAAARFHRLTRGHLLADARLDVAPPGAEAGAVAAAARAVAVLLPRVPHEPKHVRDAETALQEAYHHARDTLQARAELELNPDEDVQLLTAVVGGIRLGVAAFDQALRAERDERSSDITDSEHELFDRTLAGDTRRHLADRIRQASELVAGMNERLRRVRTASRVAVELVWQIDPRKPAGTQEARRLLLRDPGDLGEADREALHRFFRGLLDEARADDTAASWEEQLLRVLDYTAWHQFVVRLDRGDGKGWHELTRKLHGALSGGEKAIALHLPLFAAVAAHYQTDPGCPRFILLDEVFVGVDRANRGQVFQLLVDLGLDLVLTSDHEWCEYRELDGIAIHVLQTGDGDDAVTTTRFVWDGERTE